MSSLKPRLLTAAIGIPAVLLILLLSELWHPLIGIVVGLASVLMVGEFLYARRLLSQIPLAVVCMIYALVMPIIINTGMIMYAFTYLFMAAAFVIIIINHKKLHFMNFAYALFGTLLITFGMSAIPLVCTQSLSLSFYFVLIFLLPWMADGGAYFIGSKFGKHKLSPNISPNKSIEGALGGTVFCIASALLMGLLFQLVILKDCRVNFTALIILAILDSFVSILGDLSFSLIKRSLKIKDYGSIFPGHGGMLDRCDSIIFTAPLVVTMNMFVPFITVAV